MEVSGKKEGRLLNYNYCVVLLCYVIAQFGYSMVDANVASYAKSLGVAGGVLGVLPGLMSIAALCSRPFSGWVSDHFNRKRTLTIMLLSLCLVFFGYAFSVSATVLIFVRVMHGICYAFFSTTNMALVADITPEIKLGQGLGYYGLCGYAISAIAPAMGNYLHIAVGFKIMFLCAAFAYIVSFVLFQLLKYQQIPLPKSVRTEKKSIKKIISLKALPVACIGFCNTFASGAITGLLLVHAAERNISGAGLYFTVFAVVTVVSRPLCSYLADHLKPQYMVYPCDLCIIGTMIVLFFANSIQHILLAGFLFGVGYGGLQPLLQTMAIRTVNERERGIASSTYYIGLDAGNGLGPILCSAVAATCRGNYGYGYLSMILPIVCGMGIMYVWARS